MKHISSKAITALLVALMVLSLPVATVFAGSSLHSAGAGADLAGVGTIVWSNPGNITITDSNDATAALPALGISHYLAATGFGFSIPVDAPIVGIQVIITRRASSSFDVKDSSLMLIKGSAVAGANRANLVDAWTTTNVAAVYGGATDLWGEVWSPADINDPNFGVALSASNKDIALQRTARVDFVQISVTYGLPTTSGVTCSSPVLYGSGTLCTITVTQSSLLTAPTGSVQWTTDGSGAFSSGGVCSLSPSGTSGTCSVNYTPSAVGDGSHLITATYAGDESFFGSSNSQSVTVSPMPITVTADAKSKTYG
ncbi:MAG TPA: Ig-like domain-containing protein, partial [Anaerolineales bacterium]